MQNTQKRNQKKYFKLPIYSSSRVKYIATRRRKKSNQLFTMYIRRTQNMYTMLLQRSSKVHYNKSHKREESSKAKKTLKSLNALVQFINTTSGIIIHTYNSSRPSFPFIYNTSFGARIISLA